MPVQGHTIRVSEVKMSSVGTSSQKFTARGVALTNINPYVQDANAAYLRTNISLHGSQTQNSAASISSSLTISNAGAGAGSPSGWSPSLLTAIMGISSQNVVVHTRNSDQLNNELNSNFASVLESSILLQYDSPKQSHHTTLNVTQRPAKSNSQQLSVVQVTPAHVGLAEKLEAIRQQLRSLRPGKSIGPKENKTKNPTVVNKVRSSNGINAPKLESTIDGEDWIQPQQDITMKASDLFASDFSTSRSKPTTTKAIKAVASTKKKTAVHKKTIPPRVPYSVASLSPDIPSWFKQSRTVVLSQPRIVDEKDVQLGKMDAGDCARIGGELYCLPVIVCIGMKKAATGEIQRWLVKHPNMTSGFFNPAHLNGIGEVQYFNNLERRGICDHCWNKAVGGPTNEMLRNYLLMEDRNAPLFKMRSEKDVGKVFQSEKTPGYWERADPQDLFSVMPSIRLVVLFRKPSSMVYSRYWYCRSLRYYDKCGGPSFDDFLQQAFIDDDFEALSDKDKIEKGHMYPPKYNYDYNWRTPTTLISPHNFFTEKLESWFSVFDREQILIWFSDYFLKDPFGFIAAVQAHTGLPPYDYHSIAFRNEKGILTVTGTSKSKYIGDRYPNISAWAKNLLDRYYLAEIQSLKTYLIHGQTIPEEWLTVAPPDLQPKQRENVSYVDTEGLSEAQYDGIEANMPNLEQEDGPSNERQQKQDGTEGTMHHRESAYDSSE